MSGVWVVILYVYRPWLGIVASSESIEWFGHGIEGLSIEHYDELENVSCLISWCWLVIGFQKYFIGDVNCQPRLTLLLGPGSCLNAIPTWK
jgi:energy-converting hydrogenase Eha subunit G